MLVATSPQSIAIVEAFSDMADKRRSKGKRHEVAICLGNLEKKILLTKSWLRQIT